MPSKTPLDTYARREADALASADVLRARFDRVAQQRLGVFLALAAMFIAYLMVPGRPMLFLAGSLALFVIFIVLIVRHTRIRRRETWYRELAQVALEAKHRLLRRWDELGAPAGHPTGSATADPPPHHPYADDLDVFGHASLHVLLGTTGTRPGADMITEWLLAPISSEIVDRRQNAVRELAPEIEFRDELQALGRLAGPVEPKQLSLLLDWAESPAWLLPMHGLKRLAIAVPAVLMGTIALHLYGVVPYLWIVPAAVSIGIVRRHTRRIHDDFTRVSSGDSGLRRYHTLVEHVADARFEDPLLAELRGSLEGGESRSEPGTPGEASAGGDTPAMALAQLFGLVSLSNIRYNSQVHWPWNVLTLWDIHVLVRLERWKTKHGAALRGWMEALGRADALSALAALAHAHPDWAFPNVQGGTTDRPPRLEAKALGHPLLPPDSAIRNDVALGPPGSLLLVTGSNMSGKSTLLRAIGANIILAAAGGPVCAEAMALPLVDLRTSMRIRDSLEEGISYFMAELKRLKAVCDAAAAADERPVLYLLDEILQGTNTAERQIAARRILHHLLDQHAIGAVTTHDLTLVDAADLKDRTELVHFRESLEAREGDPPISFDYRLRPGIATSTNALRLMEIMGLALPEED